MRFPVVTAPWLEKAVLVHVGLLLFAASWVCGGNIGWMRDTLAVASNLGAVLTVLAFLQSGDAGREARRKAWWLVPWLLYVSLVLVSCLNPSFSPIWQGGRKVLAYTGAAHSWLPSAVIPRLAFHQLAFAAGAWLAAFNLLLAARSRRALRGLLVFGAVNTGVLAVLGTLQKVSASGYYFGAVRSPNEHFFSTFIYDNHWGAFLILWLATAAGLLFYQAGHHLGRDLWHSPFSLALIGVLILAASAPVSYSRSATAMAALVVAVALAHACIRLASFRRRQHRPAWPPVVALLVFATGAAGATGWLAERSLSARYDQTRRALGQEKSAFDALLGDRLKLYADTWKLAAEKPVFGWGLRNYGYAFMLIRPRSDDPTQQYVQSYMDAHSDWLQSLCETGFVGTGLLLLMGILPLSTLDPRTLRHPAIAYPFFGCAVILIYAWVEFPFGNGAVMITFWLIYFATLRHARLQSLAENSMPFRHERPLAFIGG